MEKFRSKIPSEEEIIFDDWEYRSKINLKYRNIELIVAIIIGIIFFIISIIVTFIEKDAFFVIIFALIYSIIISGEWLRFKNGHLIITKDTIKITNRFNYTKIYFVNYKECILKLSPPSRRDGIVLKFYDKNNKLICKYRDMLNYAADFKAELTDWEKALK